MGLPVVQCAEARLLESEARFRAAQEISPEGFAVLEPILNVIGETADFVVLYANRAAALMLGRRNNGSSLEAARLGALLPGQAGGPHGLVAKFAKVIKEKKPTNWECCIANETVAATNRVGHWYRSRALPLGAGVAVSFENITAPRRAEARARYLAEHDEPTGLINRKGFLRQFEQVVGADGAGSAHTLLLIDLDRFKTVNDTLGYIMGDKVLRLVASRLSSILRRSDVVARLAGDEFAVLLAADEGWPEGAMTVAMTIIDACALPFNVAGHVIRIGASVGIAFAATDGDPAGEVLRHADLALYRAKTEGRGRYAVYEVGTDEAALRRRWLETDLTRALKSGEFEVHYQPLLDATRTLNGMEALVRWRHPTQGLVGPVDFIPLAEETGLIVQLGELVLRQACQEAARWPGNIRIAVNLSPAQVHAPKLLETVREALDDAGLAAERLELEVTEALLLSDADVIRETLSRLRALGVQITLDDFGTGYSSLSYLLQFPFDRVKIDRSFIRDVDTRRDGAAIVRAIARLGSDLGLQVTAEGVETEAEFAFVCAEGCTDVQGFLFGKANAAVETRALIAGMQKTRIVGMEMA